MELVQKKLQREEAILLSLKKLDYLSRSQMQRLHDLGGERNARRVLFGLRQYISSFRCETGESVFYLSKAGRERVQSDVTRHKTIQAGHYLMRNDVFIRYAGNEQWRNEIRFHVEGVTTVVADAYFLFQGRRHFLEVDHLQHMNKNKDKIERYKKLHQTGVFQQKLRYFPRLVWVTLTETRKKQLLEWCEGLDTVVHLWDDIK